MCLLFHTGETKRQCLGTLIKCLDLLVFYLNRSFLVSRRFFPIPYYDLTLYASHVYSIRFVNDWEPNNCDDGNLSKIYS